MNILDRIIGAVSPRAAWNRARYRAMMAAHEASQPSRLRKFARDSQSGEAISRVEHRPLRNQARHLERNHDLVAGILDTLVTNIVGANGITIEPQPRSVSGEILEDTSRQLLDLWRDWTRFPDVTWQYTWAAAQRMACLTWMRDGECFAQILEGQVPSLNHRTRVPLSIELLEPDMVPTDAEVMLKDGRGAIIYNAWGQPLSYRVYRAHPGNYNLPLQASMDLKTIPAERMLHLKLSRRIGSGRGISQLASVITRLEDLKDYEESERIAAKIAASMAAFIQKGAPDLYDPAFGSDGKAVPRSMRFQPGMIFDDLRPGESVGTIDTNRPNSNLAPHRQGQLRAVASGVRVSYSSASRDYNGTYSAQRQELVEQYGHYSVMADAFTSQFVRPIWERFVALAQTAGLIDLPSDLDMASLDDALYIPPSMPWIDPVKEATSYEVLEKAGYISGQEIIRKRGANPRDVIDQEAAWLRMKKDAGLVLEAEQQTEEPDDKEETEDDKVV